MVVDYWYLASVLVFVVVLAGFVYRDRKKFTRESIFLLRRTKRGRNLLIKIGTRFPRFWLAVGFVSVVTGFIVSVLGLKMLVDNFLASLVTRATTPSLALLLPSPTSETVFGYGYLAVPFWYWIICIVVLALVHEGFHGIFTAREKTRIKSLGFGILAVIPLAFVEPDEKQLEKRGVWPQLRVFSAGSFANFLMAGLSLILFVVMTNAIYAPSGVDFQTYPFAQLSLGEVESLGGHSVSGTDDIVSVLEEFGENETIEVIAANETFYLQRKYFDEQLGEETTEIVVFQDYPAAKAGIEGTIIAVDGQAIKDQIDLSIALENAGEDQPIEVTLKKDDVVERVTLVTKTAPDIGEYAPDSMIYLFATFEHVIPGSIDFYQNFGEWWGSLVGMRTDVTWSTLNQKILFWEWISDNYPGLSETAQKNILELETALEGRNSPGFIGILNVTSHYEINAGLVPYKGVYDFTQGLLIFMFMINLGVGIVNLLPVKPLDGGKMLDVVLIRYVPKHSKQIMRILGYVVLALLLANFIPFGALF